MRERTGSASRDNSAASRPASSADSPRSRACATRSGSTGCSCGSTVVETWVSAVSGISFSSADHYSRLAVYLHGCAGYREGMSSHTERPASRVHPVVKDPVCGMDVDPTTSDHRLEHD